MFHPYFESSVKDISVKWTKVNNYTECKYE